MGIFPWAGWTFEGFHSLASTLDSRTWLYYEDTIQESVHVSSLFLPSF